MHPSSRVVEALLQRPLEVRESCSTTAEAHFGAYVVLSISAVAAIVTGHADLDSHSVADAEVVILSRVPPNSDDYTSTFVPWGERLSDLEVAIPKMSEVV